MNQPSGGRAGLCLVFDDSGIVVPGSARWVNPQITQRGRAATKSRFLAPPASLGMTATAKCHPERSEASAVDLWLGASSLYAVFLNVTCARLCSSKKSGRI